MREYGPENQMWETRSGKGRSRKRNLVDARSAIVCRASNHLRKCKFNALRAFEELLPHHGVDGS